ncbi:hypothetical protein MT_57005 [Pseudomonas phage phiPto-bp6g]|nr:hypothetical protein MT_57005 [Pseudomonas phage phiPto-bp6g]
MTTVTWTEKLASTAGNKPVAKGGMAGVYFEDYQLPDGYWRYTWTNFTLDPHPEFVEVNLMDGDDD